MGAGARRIGEAAGGLHDLRLAKAAGASVRRELAEVVLQERGEGGIERGGGGALVLAEGADELIGERHVYVGEELVEQLPEQALVRGVGVGGEQRDGDGLGPGVGELLDQRAGAGWRKRDQWALVSHPLRGREAQLGWHERRGRRPAELIQAPAPPAAGPAPVGGAGGCDPRGAR